MQNLKSYTWHLMLFIVVMVAFSIGVCAGSFGVSPGRITVDNAMRGSQIEKTVVFSSSTLDDPVEYSFMFEGKAGQWVEPVENIVITPGSPRVPVTFKINVPFDAANGVYYGRIISSYAGLPVDGDGSMQSAVTAGVALKLEITVSGEQRKSFDVIASKIPDTEEGSEAYLVLDIKNSGNVNIAPSRVEIDVKDRFEKTVLRKISISKFDDEIPAFERDNLIVAFNHKLPSDLYWVTIRVYNEDDLVYDDSFTFNILAKGQANRKGLFLMLDVPENLEQGTLTKIVASYKNSGELALGCTLKAEIYQEETLLDVVASEQFIIEPSDSVDIPAYYTPKTAGEQTVKAVVLCDGRESQMREAKINVSNPYAELGIPVFMVGALIIVTLLISLAKRLKTNQ